MEPTTMMLLGGGLKVGGGLLSGISGKKAAEHNARIAQQNAIIARQQARQQADQVARDSRLLQGEFLADAGARGVGMSDSVLDILGDIVSQGELERQNVLYQGELQARGFKIEAAQERARGRNAMTAAFIGAASDLLSTGARYKTQQDLLRRD